MSDTVLATVEDLADTLRVPLGTEEVYLQKLLNRAREYLNTATRRKLDTATFTEYHDGDGSRVVQLKNYPVTSVTSIHDDPDRNFTSSSLLDSTTYAVDEVNGRITLLRDPLLRTLSTVFGCGAQNIKVVYVAGYSASTVPDDLKQALLEMAGALYQNPQGRSIKSERIGGYSVVYDQMNSATSDFVRSVVERYRRFAEDQVWKAWE